MKLRLSLAIVAIVAGASAASAQVQVDGYTNSRGTYVEPHYRSAPDGDRSNNWSTKGNTNPYTGQAGTHNDYSYGSSSYGSYGSSSHRRGY